MPTVPSGSLILVTGATGFLGTYIVSALLDSGYRVRITARSEPKAAHVRDLFPGHEVEAAIVPDMSAAGAYDSALAGVQGVIHAASPLDGWNKGDPALVIGPAVAGVTNMLDGVDKAGGVGRIVQVSSIAAVDDTCTPGATYTDSQWNDASVRACETLGAAADPWDKYNASKTVAERAFWDGVRGKNYDGVAINPSLIVAPPKGYTTSEGLTGSVALGLTRWVTPGVPKEELYKRTSSNIVDARDVALACVRALSVPEASGERFILSAAPLFGNDVALAAGDVPGLTRGNPDLGFRASLLPLHFYFDGRKAEKVLGFTYRSKDETLRDTVAAVRSLLPLSA